jgi:uncharacterized protein (TIGR03437 family)
MRGNVLGPAASIALSLSAPSAFSAGGIAVLTCLNGVVRVGSLCSLWGNGFGPTQPPQQNGVPTPTTSLSPTAGSCSLVIGGVEATVRYCGGAPGSIIYQLTFTFPVGAAAGGGSAQAAITVNGTTGKFLVPAPRILHPRFPLQDIPLRRRNFRP